MGIYGEENIVIYTHGSLCTRSIDGCDFEKKLDIIECSL